MKGRACWLVFACLLMAVLTLSCKKEPTGPTEQEQTKPVIKDPKKRMAYNLGEYLAGEYASSVDKVVVSETKVTIEGKCGGDGKYLLAEITPWQDVTEMESFPYTDQLSGRNFSLTLDRSVKGREGIDYDRVFSKWAVIKVDGEKPSLDSHARYADEVAPKRSPSLLRLRSQKGLAAGGGNIYFSDCDEMKVSTITMNVLINGFIDQAGSDFTYGGIGYSIGAEWRKTIDEITSDAAQRNLVVCAILLAPTSSSYRDPENTGGNYTMPNITTAKAFNKYAAVLEYLAERYTHEGGKRIHHWIMHNEVDMSKEWTNMGDQPVLRYLDRYLKSMRICYNIVRQYDQNASVLASYTHSWRASDGGYSPWDMLTKTVSYSRAEGDFRWGVAYHPYAQDITKPEFWKNDTKATGLQTTSYVTFKNLEVIDAWIKQKENLYQGKTKRMLFLSEQGTNSPSFSDDDLAKQAAGACWAWKKVKKLDGIDAIQWHNWMDNAAEYGLHLGLRKADFQPKPVWGVWKAAGTDKEDEVFDPYLKVIGISSWDEIYLDVK